MNSEAADTPHARRAIEFARAVGAGDYKRAHTMLSSKLGAEVSPDQLEAQFGAMTEYGSGAPTVIQVMTTLDEWPGKEPGDAGWVYVAMANDTYSEAVTVVVAQEKGTLVIRSMEWGRP